jgi:hypothetical protein
LIVLPEHRERGAGRCLLDVQVNNYDVFLSLAMSPITLKVLRSMGFEEMGRVTQVGKRLRVEPQEALDMISARLGWPATGNAPRPSPSSPKAGDPGIGPGRHLAAPLAAIVNRSMALRDRRRQPDRDWSVTLTPVVRFGAEMDVLWEELAPSFPAAVQRHATYLNWKFADQPHMDYHRFVAQRNGRAVGFVIVRQGCPPEPNIGVLADLLADPSDEPLVHALLACAVEHLRCLGAKSILAASSLPSYLDAYRRFGFVETQEVVAIWRRRTAIDSGDWFLSMGDHDWDQYPLL